MSAELARYLISAAFLLNGIGMLGAGLTLPIVLRKKDQLFGHSWVVARFGTQAEAVTGTILWGLAGLGFIGAGIGYFLQASWWQSFAWLGAPADILAIALWFGAIPPGTYVGGMLAALTLGWIAFQRG